MPRTTAGTVPKLQHHRATGQARVKIAGRDYYCGRWGSKESIAKYHRLIAEFYNGNGALPVLEGKPAGGWGSSRVPCSGSSIERTQALGRPDARPLDMRPELPAPELAAPRASEFF